MRYDGEMKEHMPMTMAYVKKCKEEWLNSRDGQRYKARYEQLDDEMKKLDNEIDNHVYNYMESKHK